MPCRSAMLLAGLWGIPGIARADDLPADALDIGGRQGLLAVVQDRSGRFSAGAPVVSVIDGERRVDQALADDGEAPDGQAGDGVWVGVMPDPPTGEALRLVLSDAKGDELWSDEVPITPGMPLPRVDFVTEGDHVQARLATVQVGAIGGGAAPAPGASGSVPPPPGSTGAALPRDLASGAGLIVAGMLGLMGLLAGLVVGLVLGRRGQGPVTLAGVGEAPPPAPLPGLPDTRHARQVWLVIGEGGPARITEALVRHRAPAGPVVLAVPADRRAAFATALRGMPGVAMVAEERPAPDTLLDAAEILAPLGRPVIVVEGAEALEPPERGEHVDAVIVDLLEQAGDDVDVLVLLAPGNWPTVEPTARVRADPDGRPVPA